MFFLLKTNHLKLKSSWKITQILGKVLGKLNIFLNKHLNCLSKNHQVSLLCRTKSLLGMQGMAFQTYYLKPFLAAWPQVTLSLGSYLEKCLNYMYAKLCEHWITHYTWTDDFCEHALTYLSKKTLFIFNSILKRQ